MEVSRAGMASKERPKVQKRLSSFNHADPKLQPQVATKSKEDRTKAAKFERKAPSKSLITQASKQNAPKPSYNPEAERLFSQVLEGKLDALPPNPRSTVRIFISSTFSDMRAERNSLAREAYPQLRDYCASLGLSFQVVDLRWGVTSEATNNHLTTKICLLELENCKKVSLGPRCIAIIGNRYGYCPLPYEIPVDEYTILKDEAKTLGLEGAAILDRWYIRDDNSCPPIYSLQPVTSQLPNFLNDNPGQEDKHAADVEAWGLVEKTLVNTIHKAATSAADKGKLSKERQHFYVMSVTEHEARNGLFQNGGTSKTEGLAFLRQFEGLDGDRLTDALADRHKEIVVDNGKMEVNMEIDGHLNNLKADISKTLKPISVKNYSVDWQAGGVQPEKIKGHEMYISQFVSDFVNGIKTQIQQGSEENSSLIRQREWYSNYSETLHHVQFCLTKCETFCGQEDVLAKVKGYIFDPANRKPYVIYAKSGVGKTSVMAMAMTKVSQWIEGDHYAMIRFLGTSPMSTNIYNVIFSVCGQLADIKEMILEPHAYKTMRNLVQYFPRFLRTIASSLKVPVVIFLDSLDQLESLNNAYSANWLPTLLPPNVKIIISTLPEEHGILKNLKSVISEPSNFTEIQLLPLNTGRDIVNKYFSSKKRTLTPDQMNVVMSTVQKAASPLYLKLLMDQALTWSSFTPMSHLALPESVRVAINSLFEKLENKFGVNCIRSALGLITVGLNGLSEIEIEDALSCADDALIEIYRHHDPPVPGMVRVPPVLWARIRYDIEEYLVGRQSQGVTTLYWYHRQFIEAAKERYVKGDTGKIFHKILFELFASETGIKRTIVLTQRKNLEIVDADRNTTPQPMASSNVRKLEAMTFHLQRCLSVIDKDFVKRVTYCSFQFLQTKVASIGAAKLLEEMQDFLHFEEDKEIRKMVRFVSLCQNSLKDSIIFAFKALALINSEPDEVNLKLLKSDTREFLWSQWKTVLIPKFPCLAPRTGEPEKVYDGLATILSQRSEICLIMDESNSQLSHQDSSVTLSCVDLSTFDLTKHVCEEMSEQPFLSFDGKTLFFFSESQTALVKLNVSDGKIVTKDLADLFSNKIRFFVGNGNCITGSLNSKIVALSIETKLAVFNSSDFKSVFHLDLEPGIKVSSLHICQEGQGNLISYLICLSKPATESPNKTLLQIWKIPEEKPVCHEILNMATEQQDMSAISVDNLYFVCCGDMEEGKSVIISTAMKSPSLLTHTAVDGKIISMKMSPSDPTAAFQIGDSEIKFLDISVTQFVKNLNHSLKIQAWSVNWDEGDVVVVGENNSFTVYNPNMETIFTRSGNFGTVDSLVVSLNQILMLTRDKKAKIWGFKDFFGDELAVVAAERRVSINEKDMLSSQDDVLSFVISADSKQLITANRDRLCQVWNLENDSQPQIRKFDIGIAPTKMLLGNQNKIIGLDNASMRVVVFDWNDGKILCNDLPEKVMDMVMNKNKTMVYLVTLESKPVLYQYDLKSNSSSRKFSVNINFVCVTAQIFLSASERYAAFLIKHTPEDFKAIQALRAKMGKFPTENYNKRFVAVDITQSSGSPFYALYNLAKIPHLGVTMEPYTGNQMMLSTRRWVMFWDIPTGKCDQRLSKTTRMTKMYRPLWLGQQCVGDNNVISMSDNQKYVAVGSQDGYVFSYESETGIPVGQKAPTGKHSSPVKFAKFTHDGELIASSCTGGYVKLWQPSTGNCLFSISVGTELRQMKFSKDGNKLVAVTLADKSHMLVFDVKRIIQK